jgi:hypothetical protein
LLDKIRLAPEEDVLDFCPERFVHPIVRVGKIDQGNGVLMTACVLRK